MMKTVLITGVNGGMGAACAQLFKSEGYKVLGTDRIKRVNEAVDIFFEGEITDESMWRSISASLEDSALDALINIAGRNYYSEISEANLDEWRNMFDVNIIGMVAAIKHMTTFLKRAENAAIVNMSSISGYIGSHGYAAYCATKGAVDSLTKSLALELAPTVRVNAIAPGWIETPFTVAGLELADDPVAYRKNVEKMHALNRVGTPKEIAKTILFLASSQSSFMTGSVVICDGGYMVKN